VDSAVVSGAWSTYLLHIGCLTLGCGESKFSEEWGVLVKKCTASASRKDSKQQKKGISMERKKFSGYLTSKSSKSLADVVT
jgi:hypothetical protein